MNYQDSARAKEARAEGFDKSVRETVDEGLEHSASNVYTEYADPKRSEWITKMQPALEKAKLKPLVRLCKNKLSRREIIELRAGRGKPHRKTPRNCSHQFYESLAFYRKFNFGPRVTEATTIQ